MTTLLSRFLRKSESKNIKVGAKSAPMYTLQVKPMLGGPFGAPKEEDLTILIDSSIVRCGGYR